MVRGNESANNKSFLESEPTSIVALKLLLSNPTTRFPIIAVC